MSIISIISLALSPNPRTAAIYYFITALFILLACFDTYFALPLNVSPYAQAEDRITDECSSKVSHFSEIFPLPRPSLHQGTLREETAERSSCYALRFNLQAVFPPVLQCLLYLLCHVDNLSGGTSR